MLEVWFESKEEAVFVRDFAIRERLDDLFDVTVTALCLHDDLDLEALVGRPAGMLLGWGSPIAPRVWSGVCTSAEQIKVESTGLSTYRVRIAPSLWLLTQRVDQRVFEHMTVPAIVDKVLGRYSQKAQWHLSEPHPEHEFRVQFGETDFAFISRLLEEEGISYYFRQIEEGQGHRSQLVLSDAPGSAEIRPGMPLRYVDSPSPSANEYVTHVRLSHSVRPGKVALRDYDFARPSFVFESKSERAEAPEATLEQYRYKPTTFIKDRQGKTHVATPEESSRLAKIAIDQQRHKKRRVSFESNALDLGAGTVLAFEGHPRADLGPEHRVVVTEVFLQGAGNEEWSLSARASFAKDPIVPEPKTPKPEMLGSVSAVVVGRRGEEIHTDEHGRVRVQFHWDREGGYDEQSSCWVRVSQDWAGSAWGLVTLPRVGHEVLVGFFEGDPDHPIVVGRIYNSRTRAPYNLPAERTRSTWKSSSSPNSDGFNELMFEDKAGRELVYVQAQRDLAKLVIHNETETTGVGRTQSVGGSRTSVVGQVDDLKVTDKHIAGVTRPPEREGDPPPPPDTFIEAIVNSILHTTTKATSRIRGGEIALDAAGKLAIEAGGDVVLEGAKIYVNSKLVAGQDPSFEAARAARAARPAGRTLGAIKAAFSPKDQPDLPPPAWEEIVIPYRPQVGDGSALAAAGMAMDHFHQVDSTQKAPSAKDLLKKALGEGMTRLGEVTPADLERVVKAYDYGAKSVKILETRDLKEVMKAGRPVLVRYAANKLGEPGLGVPQWATLKGAFEQGGVDYVVASHGMPGAATKVLQASELLSSLRGPALLLGPGLAA